MNQNPALRASRPTFAAALASLLLTAASARAADFNGDGFDDLAISSRGSGNANLFWRGRVTVLFGSNGSGLTSVGLVTFDADNFLIPDDFAQLGAALAAGDFNGDGKDDLAIGIPGASVANQPDAGEVLVIPGAASGFDLTGATLWTQNSDGVKDKVEPPFELEGHHLTEQFGSALAAGDFDGDGFDDLAIGVGESTKTVPNSGAIHVLHGSPDGLVGKKRGRLRFVSQETDGVKGKSEPFDYFGALLHAGDFDGDGKDDLASQSRGESTVDGYASGALNLLFGSKHGVSTKHHRAIGAKRLGEPPEFSLSIADALASGDFDNDGRAELAIGMPGHASNTGRMLVARLPNQKFDFGSLVALGSSDVDGMVTSVESDLFGASCAAADFDGDGFDDLAVGMPGADFSGLSNAGRVGVLRGSPTGILTPGKFLIEGAGGVSGTAEQFDNFGEVLTTGDFDGDGFFDLVVGIPRQDVDVVIPMPATRSDAGAFTVIYGAMTGLGTGGSAQFTEPAGAESLGQFGTVLCK